MNAVTMSKSEDGSGTAGGIRGVSSPEVRSQIANKAKGATLVLGSMAAGVAGERGLRRSGKDQV
jgi:hypothetical protein